MALTPAEESEFRALLAERAAAREAKRLFDLEHKRMARGRAGLTPPENAELDAHLAAREAAANQKLKRENT